ncbi:LysE family translocator [Amaricoccus solimangrovi]|uniref:LysE family translocator n=1 Tax=Amaricoccus solimangrovi TaxID=2589815 RepID=A0A501WV23_9RHOB|nr:LysE family translocator [Amaricoccus solimangrovi]TPE53603.1 LysE family translocator [Amaricoccus solimangrovi]
MAPETWLAFAAASAVLLVIPGPTILLVVSYALGRGWKVAAPVATGVALGDLTAMTLSMLGVGALLAGSAALFTALKWIGAAYLVFLGVKLWRAGGALRPEAGTEAGTEAGAPGRMLAHAWLVTTLNPKSIVFFVAFTPQFVDPARRFAPQAAILVATFVTLAFANAFGYALAAARARRLAGSPRAIRLVNRAGGAALIAAATAAVTLRTA